MRIFFSIVLIWHLLNPVYSAAQKKYNVLNIAVDDLNIQFDLYGNPDVHAPNIARLAKHGMLFTQAYCQYALCSPSRTSVMSGQRPDATGIFGNDLDIRTFLGADYKFLPEYFNFYGYRTEKFGKVASCKHEDEIAWDFKLDGEGEARYGLRGTPDWWIDTVPKSIEETIEMQITDSCIEKIKKPVAYPYFYGLGLSSHNPYTPILDSWNQLGDDRVRELMPVNIDGTVTNVYGNGSGNIILPNTPVDDLDDIPPVALKDSIFFPPDEVQRIRHAYYGEIVELDEQLGKVLDQLDSLNLWDSTIVIFWSDHGIHLGEHHGQWLKLTLFEEALRVPFIICAPGKKPGVCTTPVELVDMFATLADLCGLPVPPGQQGSSLAPLLENPDLPWTKAAFAQLQKNVGLNNAFMGRSVRTTKFHYNSWDSLGEELYRITTDPYEYVNLANKTAYKNVLDSMRALLAGGWQGALPPVYTKHSFFKDDDGDGYGRKKDSVVAYFVPTGYADQYGDCNDNNPDIHPGADEKPCNGKDDNCNSRIDENKPEPKIIPLGNLDICNTGSVELVTDARSNFAYQWKRDGKNIPGAIERNYTARNVGTYKVIISYEGVCGNISKGIAVTNSCISTVSDNENLPVALVIFPNPANDMITVTYNNKNTAGKINLQVYDRVGNLVFNQPVNMIRGVNAYKLDVSRLQAGVYHVEVNNGSFSEGNKLMIER